MAKNFMQLGLHKFLQIGLGGTIKNWQVSFFFFGKNINKCHWLCENAWPIKWIFRTSKPLISSTHPYLFIHFSLHRSSVLTPSTDATITDLHWCHHHRNLVSTTQFQTQEHTLTQRFTITIPKIFLSKSSKTLPPRANPNPKPSKDKTKE